MRTAFSRASKAAPERDDGPEPPPHLAVTGISVSFGRFRALNDVTFECRSSITGIVGPNGAGKSTLLNVLSGQIRPTDGAVFCLGQPLAGMSAARRSRFGIGRSFQHPVLADALTVRESLALTIGGRRDRSIGRRRVDEVVGQFGLGPWLASFVHELPYGVRKLVDIARAVSADPKILFSDEPLSGLDEQSRDQMVGVLRSVAESGTPVVVVEHDVPRLSRFAADLVVLDLGKVIAQGAPRTVLREATVIEAFIGTEYTGADPDGDGS